MKMCAKMIHTNEKSSDLAAKWLSSSTEEWLKSYPKEKTKSRVKGSLAHFCEWIGKSDVQLVAEYKASDDKDQWQKDMGNKLVEYVNVLRENGYAVNTARASVGNVMAFFTNQCRSVKIPRKKLPKQQVATGEHEFSIVELRKMFHYADVRGKAVLSTAVALGWAADDFLSLKRAEVEPYVRKAVSEKLEFIAFDHVRGKTGAVSRSHLTPEAIESLKQYLDVTPKNAEYLWANGSKDSAITNETLNAILKELVTKAGIQTTGIVRFHLIRKFTMSALSASGIGDWDVKFLIGKEVAPDMATYLINRKETLLEEFKNAYPRLSLIGYVNGGARDRVAELEEKNKKLEDQVSMLWQVLDSTMKALEEKSEVRKQKMDEIRRIIVRERSRRTSP